MELREALGHIADIRHQLERTETFRDFRSLTIGFSGVCGIGAAILQAARIPFPTEQVTQYVGLWSAVACLNLLLVSADVGYRWSMTRSPLRRRLTVRTVEQFVPCLIAGGVFTTAVDLAAPQIAWTLPGIWSLFFALGIFSCVRSLPRLTFWIGVYYLSAGAICLGLGPGPHALSPWMMAGSFGLGQLLTAGILYFALERRHEPLET